MKLSAAIDAYIADMRLEGRITSTRTERSYRDVLYVHTDDVGNRDPRTTGRQDVKRTLARWPNPNTQRTRRAVLVSFYDWCMEEGHRKDNPARQTRRPKAKKTSTYRMSRAEAASMLRAATGYVERRAIYLGICAGLRSAELRGLRGRHFARDGFIWVSGDIAKGGRERWLPIIGDLAPIVDEIRRNVGADDHILPGQTPATVSPKLTYRYVPERPMGGPTLWRMVGAVAKRAGIDAHIHPHLLRHAHADYITRAVGLEVAQALLGHADIKTTRGYTDQPTLEELSNAVSNVSFLAPFGLPPAETGGKPKVETAGIEPADSTGSALEPKPPPGGPP